MKFKNIFLLIIITQNHLLQSSKSTTLTYTPSAKPATTGKVQYRSDKIQAAQKAGPTPTQAAQAAQKEMSYFARKVSQAGSAAKVPSLGVLRPTESGTYLGTKLSTAKDYFTGTKRSDSGSISIAENNQNLNSNQKQAKQYPNTAKNNVKNERVTSFTDSILIFSTGADKFIQAAKNKVAALTNSWKSESKTTKNFDGSVTVKNPDGSTTTTAPINQKTGSVTSITSYPGGRASMQQTSADGTVQYFTQEAVGPKGPSAESTFFILKPSPTPSAPSSASAGSNNSKTNATQIPNATNSASPNNQVATPSPQKINNSVKPTSSSPQINPTSTATPTTKTSSQTSTNTPKREKYQHLSKTDPHNIVTDLGQGRFRVQNSAKTVSTVISSDGAQNTTFENRTNLHTFANGKEMINGKEINNILSNASKKPELATTPTSAPKNPTPQEKYKHLSRNDPGTSSMEMADGSWRIQNNKLGIVTIELPNGLKSTTYNSGTSHMTKKPDGSSGVIDVKSSQGTQNLRY